MSENLTQEYMYMHSNAVIIRRTDNTTTKRKKGEKGRQRTTQKTEDRTTQSYV